MWILWICSGVRTWVVPQARGCTAWIIKKLQATWKTCVHPALNCCALVFFVELFPSVAQGGLENVLDHFRLTDRLLFPGCIIQACRGLLVMNNCMFATAPHHVMSMYSICLFEMLVPLSTLWVRTFKVQPPQKMNKKTAFWIVQQDKHLLQFVVIRHFIVFVVRKWRDPVAVLLYLYLKNQSSVENMSCFWAGNTSVTHLTFCLMNTTAGRRSGAASSFHSSCHHSTSRQGNVINQPYTSKLVFSSVKIPFPQFSFVPDLTFCLLELVCQPPGFVTSLGLLFPLVHGFKDSASWFYSPHANCYYGVFQYTSGIICLFLASQYLILSVCLWREISDEHCLKWGADPLHKGVTQDKEMGMSLWIWREAMRSNEKDGWEGRGEEARVGGRGNAEARGGGWESSNLRLNITALECLQ